MKIAVLGAGSWGTTLAVHLAEKGNDITLWEFFEDRAADIKRKRENRRFLPGIKIPRQIKITSSMEEALDKSEVVVVVVPSHCVRSVARKVAPIRSRNKILSGAKGIEEGSLRRMSEVISEELPESRVCVLSGPSHAEEVSRKIPTTVTVSSPDSALAEDMQELFISSSFRVYTNDDMAGVELGGALKNIIAIASGISDGLGFGDNTKAAILTRGLAEITRLGVAMGARPETFSALSGMGDLIATCISRHSRNRKLGELMAKGKALEESLKIIDQAVEGVRTTACAYELSRTYRVEVPMTEQVRAVLFQGKDPREAASELMERVPRPELDDTLRLRRH